jgi:hypothetical protein
MFSLALAGNSSSATGWIIGDGTDLNSLALLKRSTFQLTGRRVAPGFLYDHGFKGVFAWLMTRKNPG